MILSFFSLNNLDAIRLAGKHSHYKLPLAMGCAVEDFFQNVF
jgi:hypothetical protein